jgi:hypothetical protein
VLGEIVSLDDEHDKSVELFMPVDKPQQVAWIALGKDLECKFGQYRVIVAIESPYRKYILQRRLKQILQLLLGDELKQRRLKWVSSNVIEELHWNGKER